MTGIVILNYNNSSQTESCLESLYSHCPAGTYKICVVDNASRPEELAKLRSFCREHIIVADRNGGYASGNDLGCEYFDADPQVDKILILNDDTRFTENILCPMEAYLDNHPGCGVVFPLVKAPDGSVDKACARRSKSRMDLFLQATSLGRFGIKRSEFIPTEGLDAHDSLATGVPPGSCMMLRKDQFREIGWLDRHTFLYFEEHILSEKLKRMGLECVLLPKISIIHLGAQTTNKQPSKAIYGHWRDSYLYYLENWSGMPAPVRLWLRLRTWLKLLTL
ncbi:MAG: glycosyltransferase family 2 protein [Bacteroidales bacterium]|nr:glycosyltransferase family 2 protein [Bacteroidales bacterium]